MFLSWYDDHLATNDGPYADRLGPDEDLREDSSVPFAGSVAMATAYEKEDELLLLTVDKANAITASTSANSIISDAITPEEMRALDEANSQTGKSTGKSKRRQRRRDPDELGLTPQELHRKRNRESLQRARKRQREQIEQMKTMLQQLTQQYAQLHEQFQDQQQIVTQPDVPEEQLAAKYYALADLSHALKEEQYRLERALLGKQLTYQRIQQVLIDRVTELRLPDPFVTFPSGLLSYFEYTPITEAQVMERIRQSYQQMRSLEATAQPLRNAKPASCGSSTFGWEITCKIAIPNAFFACFSKFFPGVSAQTAMQRVWETEIQCNDHEIPPPRRLVRYERLQTFNDNTFTIGLDIEHPIKHGRIMRSVALTYRVATEDGGFAIGNSTINPASSELRATAEEQFGIEHVDWGSWMEFIPKVDPVTGQTGCLLKCYDRTDYNTQEDTYLRLLNALRSTLLWENVVAPSSSLQLLSASI